MTYRAGVAGVGRVGRNHAEAYRATEGVELAAVADVDADLVAELGALWDVPERRRYAGLDRMLEAEDLDALSVATPASLHYDHVLAAADSRADPSVVLCEKPIATTVDRAAEMTDACGAAGVDLVVNHSRRFSAAVRRFRELVHDGDLLGDLRSAHLVAAPELLNTGTHFVDLLLYLLDADVAAVRGGDVAPVAVGDATRFAGGGTLAMADGAVAHLGPREGAALRLYLDGTGGRASVPLSVGREAGREWRYWDGDGGRLTPAEPPAPLSELWREDVAGTHSTYEPGMVPAQTLFEAAADHVVALLDGRDDDVSPGAAAVHGLSVLTGLVVSTYAGRRVELPLAEPLRSVPLAVER